MTRSTTQTLRYLLAPLFFMAILSGAQADPPEIDSPSPDQTWMITARWAKRSASETGYDWDLRNIKTGKVYFHENKHIENEALPHRFGALWSPDSHYAAINLYYGRAVVGTAIIRTSIAEPQFADLNLCSSNTTLDKTLIHRQDLDSYKGYNRLLVGADHWINNADLSIDIFMIAYLDDKKSGIKQTLSTEWHKTVRFAGKSSRVITDTCDDYDKKPRTD